MAVDQSKLLSRLLEVTRNLSTMVDLETYLRSILSAAAELTESETASVMEYDDVSQELSFKYVPWFHRAMITSSRIPRNCIASGWLFLNVKPLMISDVKSEGLHCIDIGEGAVLVTSAIWGGP